MTRMSDEFFEKHSLTYEQTATVEAVRLTTDNIMAVAAETEGTIEFGSNGQPSLCFRRAYGDTITLTLGSLVTKNSTEVDRWSGRRSEWVEVQG